MTESGIVIAAAIAIPVFVFILNWIMRSRLGYALTAAADFALAIIAFDLAAAAGHGALENIIREEFYKQNFVTLVIVLGCCTGTIWSTFLLKLEHTATRGYSHIRRAYTNRIQYSYQSICFLTGWALVAGLIAPHIIVFAYR